MSTARRRKSKKKKSGTNKRFLKILPYILIGFVFIFLVYRIIVLISFKIDCSSISKSTLSHDQGMISDLYIFETEGSISNIEVLIYSKDQKNILKISIPTSIYVSPEYVDDVPIASLESVGEFLEYGKGKEYTIGYLSDLLGIKFNNYVWLVDSSDNSKELFKDLSVWSVLFNFKYSHELRGNVNSNLPILNLITHINFLSSLTGEYMSEDMDILNCCVNEVVIGGDNKQVHFDKGGFDSEISKYLESLTSSEVQRERVNVEVYNASDISGLASTYARKIRHTGCRILRYDNAPSLSESTIIYVPEPEEYHESLELIRDVMGEGVEVRNDRPQFITTGDIVVVLGKDISD
jgi:hypothetical protein